MIHNQLSAWMAEALLVARWGEKKGALEDALLKVCADPLAIGLDLSGLRRLMMHHPDATTLIIKKLQPAKLRSLVKAVNPYRAVKPADASDIELIQELLALAKTQKEPAQKPPPPLVLTDVSLTEARSHDRQLVLNAYAALTVQKRKKVLRNWDEYFRPPTNDDGAILSRFSALLAGAELTQAPASAPRRATRPRPVAAE